MRASARADVGRRTETAALGAKPPNPPMTRRERRAATRQDRYDSARDARRSRAPAGGASGLFTTRNVTIAAVAIGILLVAVLAAGQLGGKTTSGTFADPGIE